MQDCAILWGKRPCASPWPVSEEALSLYQWGTCTPALQHSHTLGPALLAGTFQCSGWVALSNMALELKSISRCDCLYPLTQSYCHSDPAALGSTPGMPLQVTLVTRKTRGQLRNCPAPSGKCSLGEHVMRGVMSLGPTTQPSLCPPQGCCPDLVSPIRNDPEEAPAEHRPAEAPLQTTHLHGTKRTRSPPISKLAVPSAEPQGHRQDHGYRCVTWSEPCVCVSYTPGGSKHAAICP